MSTDPARSAARAADALEHVNDALIVVDRAWTIEYANAVATELVEHDADDMVGLSFWDIFPESYDHEFGIAYRRVMDTGVEERIETFYGPLRGWFDVRVIPSDAGITFCFQNVNERRAAVAAQEALVQAITALAESTTVEAIEEALAVATHDVLGVDVTALVLGADGSVSLASSDGDTALDERRERVLQMLSAQCSAALERLSVLERQRAIAGTLQQAMLPTALPVVPGADIAASYVPATADLSVGGDWYDAIRLRNGSLAIAIGDVAGHGVDAAAAMGQVRNAFRAYAVDGHGPASILQRLDVLIDEAGSHDLFTTAIVAVYDPASGALRWSNAGHLPLLLRDGTGARFLDSPVGAPIGVRGPAGFSERDVVLAPGDLVLAYTDGLVERRDEHLADGLERLRKVLEHVSLATEAACRETIAALGGPRRGDDICVIALRRSS